jgi:hypothetical protein
MALGENEGMSTTMLVSPTGGNINTGYAYPAPVYALGNQNGGGMGFGGDWGSLITLFLLFGMFGGGFGGFGGGYGGFGGYDFPWLLTGQQGINNNTNAGFRDAQISDSITSVRDGISGLSTQLCGCCSDVQMSLANGFAGVNNNLCNGFNGVNASINGAQNALAQQMYTNQLADLERSFAAQTANTAGLTNLSTQLAQCCCDNRAATQDVKFTIAQEECATRANSTANTQAILDKLCQLELDGYKRENDNLRSQLQFANMQASQVAQTSELRTSQATVANQLVQELRSCPIPAQPVYGNSPIFTCAQNVAGGCGCGFNG